MSYRPERPSPPERSTQKRGASAQKLSHHGRLSGYGVRHAQVLLASLGRLWQHPVATLFSIAVIGIALALPAGMSVLVGNVRALSGVWDSSARMTVFLQQNVGSHEAAQARKTVSHMPGVKSVRLITPDQALEEFRQRSNFDSVLATLDHNPLPAVLVVTPLGTHTSVSSQLAKRIDALKAVASVRVDTQWLQRLAAIMTIAHRMIIILAALFAVGVVIIIGNTIRLDIENRRPEIEISTLIGATNAFIRRPFLYAGLWYGLAGGICAWLLVSLSLLILDNPVRYLAGLYHSNFALSGLGAGDIALLLVAGAGLGWLGSWFAVTRHLSKV